MTVRFLDLSRSVAAQRGELEAAVARVLDRATFVLGEPVVEFERAFATYCGARHAVGVGSGTDAIQLALSAVGVEPGDDVITAASTCIPTLAGIEAAGAVPVLADVDPATRTLDPVGLAEAMTPRTRAIVPVHLYGQPADLDPILAFAREHGLKVVEDAAQAHGAEYGGRRVGPLGDAGAFSFYPTKNLGALGDAGAIVTDDDDVAERARMLRAYGERERYESVLHGTNSRLDTLQAAALLARLPQLDAWNARRAELAARYLDALAGTALVLPHTAEGRTHVYHLFVVETPERDHFREALADRGVETLVHYPRPAHGHPAYRHLAREGRLGVSERLAREVVSLPLYPELTDAEAESVVVAVRRAAGRS